MSEQLIEDTKRISQIIFKSCIDQIDNRFGNDYSKKNPQLVSSYIDLNKIVYQSMQVKQQNQ